MSTVFVSSVITGFESYREAAAKAIEEFGFRPVRSERHPARELAGLGRNKHPPCSRVFVPARLTVSRDCGAEYREGGLRRPLTRWPLRRPLFV